MKRIIMNIVLAFTLIVVVSAQQFQVGDVVDVNFTEPICSNGGLGNNTWYLYESDGALNGGEYHVIWLIFFASW